MIERISCLFELLTITFKLVSYVNEDETLDGKTKKFKSPMTSFYFIIPSTSSGKCGTISPHTMIDDSIQYQNTLIIQSDALVQRSSDIVKKLTCNWKRSYEKNISLSSVAISNDSRTVEEIIFTDDSGSRVKTWMDLTYGENNPFGETITRPLTVGTKVTLAIYITDSTDEFDVQVKNCKASQLDEFVNKNKSLNPSSYSLELTQNGCSMRKELIDNFIKLNSTMIHHLRTQQLQEVHTERKNLLASKILYSNVILFKFPEQNTLSFSCTIQLCKDKCTQLCDNRDDKFKINAEMARNNLTGEKNFINFQTKEIYSTLLNEDVTNELNRTNNFKQQQDNKSNLSLLQLLPAMSNETIYYSRSVEYKFNMTESVEDDDKEKNIHSQENNKNNFINDKQSRSSRQLNITSMLQSNSEANVHMEKRINVIAPNLDDEPDVIDALFEKYFTTTSSSSSSSNNSNVLHLIVCFPFPWLLLAVIIFFLSLIITIYISFKCTFNQYQMYPSDETSKSLCPITFTNCKAYSSYNQDV